MSSAAVGAQTPVLTVCSQADPRRVVASVVIDVVLLAAPGVLAYVLPGPAVVRLALVLCTVVTVVMTGYAHMLHGRAAGGAILGLRTVDRSAGLPTGTYEALITPLRGGQSAHAITLSTRPGPDPVRGTLATLGHTTSPQAVSQPPAAPTPEVASTPLSASSAPLPPEAPAPSPGPGARLSSDTAIRPFSGPAARPSSDTAIRPFSGPATRPSSDTAIRPSSDSDTAVRPGVISPAQPGHAPAPPPSELAGTGAGRAPSPTAPASPASPTGAPASGDSPASPASSPATPTTTTPVAPAGTSSSHPPVTLVRASAPTRVSVMPSGSATKRPGTPAGAATIPTRTSVMPGTSRTSAPPPGPTAPAHGAPRPAPAPPPAPVQVTITSLPVPAPADDSATSLPPLVVTGAAITPSPVAPPPPSSPPPPAASAPPSAAPASPSSPATSSPSVPRRSTRALLSEAGPRARATADVDTLRRPPREDPAATSVRMEPLALPTPTSPSPLPASPTPRAPSPTTSPATRRASLSPSTASLPRPDPQSTLTSLASTSPAANRHAQPPTSRSRSRAQSPARHAATPEPAEPVIPPAPTPAEWRIRMVDDNGWQAVITRPTILGRALRRRSGGADTALLTVPDTSESASKEHAMLNIHNHLLVVTDLGSAKGTTIRMRDGRTYPCTAHQPVATPLPSVISLGGYQLSLTEE